MTHQATDPTRSALMARVRSQDTKPELEVRRLLRGLGIRYRLHVRTLPGSPDIVLPGRRKVIFVHGCYWHRHPGCRLASTPKSNTEFWLAKFARNQARDEASLDALAEAGWEVLVVWQCQLRDEKALSETLLRFLGVRRS